jgi:O-antigen chain-terminating methyltransferase
MSKVAGARKNLRESKPELMHLGVAEILRKINATVLRSKGTGVTGVNAMLWPENFEIWTSAEPPTPQQSVYDLSELLVLDDADFVANAYRVLFRRAPDAAGMAANLESLRGGSQDKLGILATMRFSAEGMHHGVPIRGLRKSWLLHRWKQKRGIGPLLAWAHEFSRLGRRASRTDGALLRAARETHRLGRHVNQAVYETGTRLELLEHELASFRAGRKALEQATQASVDRLQGLVVTAEQLSERLEGVAIQLERDEEILRRLDARETQLLESERRNAALKPQLDALYSAFEDHFRGPEELIRERARPYLDVVRACGAGTADAPVIDVGCGRGEWLDLLRSEGLHARGIDLNSDFVQNASARGLHVTEGDAIEVLRQMPAGQAGAITSMHLVEHLPFERVVEFIDACWHALKPGGAIILETPNPENLDVATLYFYMDPTHRNPLPPEMLRWVVESRGYPAARIMRMTEQRAITAPPLLAEEIPGSASVNHLLVRTHIAPDYAIVGNKVKDAT